MITVCLARQAKIFVLMSNRRRFENARGNSIFRQWRRYIDASYEVSRAERGETCSYISPVISIVDRFAAVSSLVMWKLARILRARMFAISFTV